MATKVAIEQESERENPRKKNSQQQSEKKCVCVWKKNNDLCDHGIFYLVAQLTQNTIIHMSIIPGIDLPLYAKRVVRLLRHDTKNKTAQLVELTRAHSHTRTRSIGWQFFLCSHVLPRVAPI